MPLDNGVKVNGKVPWVVVTGIIAALVGYGILLGQVAQIDQRLGRIETMLYGRTSATAVPSYTERKPNAQILVGMDAGTGAVVGVRQISDKARPRP
jgi:hypothetical protein